MILSRRARALTHRFPDPVTNLPYVLHCDRENQSDRHRFQNKEVQLTPFFSLIAIEESTASSVDAKIDQQLTSYRMCRRKY